MPYDNESPGSILDGGANLLAMATSLEIGDPVGGPMRRYRATRDRIAGLSASVADYLTSPARRHP